MRYRFVDQNRFEYAVEKMCRMLKISRSGYYAWKNQKPVRRKLDERLKVKIGEIYRRGRGNYGVGKITGELKKVMKINHKKVYRLMKEMGIQAKTARKYKATTNSEHNLPVAGNILNRQFKPGEINKVWVSDITYIRTLEGWLYLAVVKDLYNNEIVGYSMGERMTKELVISALENGIKKKRPGKGLVHHSDRGSQYCSEAYQRILIKNEMTASMSRKGNCYDNACAENFFSVLKQELIYQQAIYITRKEAKRSIFEYIEVFYNRIRVQKRLNYLSPVEFIMRQPMAA